MVVIDSVHFGHPFLFKNETLGRLKGSGRTNRTMAFFHDDDNLFHLLYTFFARNVRSPLGTR